MCTSVNKNACMVWCTSSRACTSMDRQTLARTLALKHTGTLSGPHKAHTRGTTHTGQVDGRPKSRNWPCFTKKVGKYLRKNTPLANGESAGPMMVACLRKYLMEMAPHGQRKEQLSGFLSLQLGLMPGRQGAFPGVKRHSAPCCPTYQWNISELSFGPAEQLGGGSRCVQWKGEEEGLGF